MGIYIHITSVVLIYPNANESTRKAKKSLRLLNRGRSSAWILFAEAATLNCVLPTLLRSEFWDHAIHLRTCMSGTCGGTVFSPVRGRRTEQRQHRICRGPVSRILQRAPFRQQFRLNVRMSHSICGSQAS